MRVWISLKSFESCVKRRKKIDESQAEIELVLLLDDSSGSWTLKKSWKFFVFTLKLLNWNLKHWNKDSLRIGGLIAVSCIRVDDVGQKNYLPKNYAHAFLTLVDQSCQTSLKLN